MMTRSGIVKACLLTLALGAGVASPALAENARKNGRDHGNRGQHRGHDNWREDRRHDHRYEQPLFGFGLFGGPALRPNYNASPNGYYPPPPRGYYRAPPPGYYGY